MRISNLERNKEEGGEEESIYKTNGDVYGLCRRGRTSFALLSW